MSISSWFKKNVAPMLATTGPGAVDVYAELIDQPLAFTTDEMQNHLRQSLGIRNLTVTEVTHVSTKKLDRQIGNGGTRCRYMVRARYDEPSIAHLS